MMNIALFLAAAAINLVTAAPTDVMERGCSAVRFNGGTYYSTHMQMSSADLIAPLGKTITATIVDKITCVPYTGTDISIQSITGSAFDRDWNCDTTNGLGFSETTVSGSNTVSFVTTTPNGGTNLSLSVSGSFTPSNLTNFQWAFATLGVKYGVA